MKPMIECIREAIRAARESDDADTAVLAQVEAGGEVSDSFLTYLTDTPSGKRYGLLTVGAAERWLKSLGIKLATDGEGRKLRIFDVEVHVSGYGVLTVEAYDADEAREAAEEWAQDGGVELEIDAGMAHEVTGEKKRGAA